MGLGLALGLGFGLGLASPTPNQVFHQYYQPLEWRLVKSRADRSAFVKLIVHKADSDRVVGMHVCGPHAGEITLTYLLTDLPILCPALT